jgi:hypothetical protein
VLRRGEIFFFRWLFAVWERRVGMGKKNEKQGRRGSAQWWYIHFCRWNHRRTTSIRDFIGNFDGELVTSLYGDPGLNPSVIPSVKSPAKTSMSTNCLFFYSKYSVCNFIDIYRQNYLVGIYQPNYRQNNIRQ